MCFTDKRTDRDDKPQWQSGQEGKKLYKRPPTRVEREQERRGRKKKLN